VSIVFGDAHSNRLQVYHKGGTLSNGECVGDPLSSLEPLALRNVLRHDPCPPDPAPDPSYVRSIALMPCLAKLIAHSILSRPVSASQPHYSDSPTAAVARVILDIDRSSVV